MVGRNSFTITELWHGYGISKDEFYQNDFGSDSDFEVDSRVDSSKKSLHK